MVFIRPFLKKMSDSLHVLFSCFMNACYSHCFVPENLLCGDVNPNIKDTKGNSTDSANYRPVMQSSCLLKLFEIHLLGILEEKLIFNNRQFGFRKNTSTADACLILKETIYKYISKGNDSVYCLFVDLSKAFDNVDHIKLGRILLKRNIPPDIVLLLMHYLCNQSARIIWNEGKGEYHHIYKGVRQGGILSPLLFKLYIDDILNDICNSGIGCNFGIMRMNVIAYADDIVLVANKHQQLSEIYRILYLGMTERKLKINKDKSKCMIFAMKNRSFYAPDSLVLNGDNFEVVCQYKYLGHLLENNLSDKNDINFRLNAFYAKFNWLYRNFNNISLDVFYFLFTSFCIPDYGLSLWNIEESMKKPIYKSFEVAFSNALKKILSVPISSSSHAVAGVFNQFLFTHYVTFNQVRYFKRILKSFNPILRLSNFIIKQGFLYKMISKRIREFYNCCILSNDLSILRARIFWVQNHEPHTGRPIGRQD